MKSHLNHFYLWNLPSFRQEHDDDIRCLYHTLAVFDNITNLSSDEYDDLLTCHEKIIFNKALTDEEYYTMAQEILTAQEAMKDKYYGTNNNYDNSSIYLSIDKDTVEGEQSKIDSLKMEAMKLDESNSV